MAGSPEVKRMTPSLQHPASGNHERIRCLASVAEDVDDPTGHTDGGAGRRQRPHLAETVPRPPLQHVEDLLVLLMHVSEGKSPPGGMADSNTPTRRLEQRLPRQCRAGLRRIQTATNGTTASHSPLPWRSRANSPCTCASSTTSARNPQTGSARHAQASLASHRIWGASADPQPWGPRAPTAASRGARRACAARLG